MWIRGVWSMGKADAVCVGKGGCGVYIRKVGVGCG